LGFFEVMLDAIMMNFSPSGKKDDSAQNSAGKFT
jgi:hypothetical protein